MSECTIRFTHLVIYLSESFFFDVGNTNMLYKDS